MIARCARRGAYAHLLRGEERREASYVADTPTQRGAGVGERERREGGERERIPKHPESGRCLPAVTFKRWSKYKTLARIKETNSWRAQYELNMLINN